MRLEIAALATTSAAVGFTVGYRLATNRLEAKYADLADNKIEEYRERGRKARKEMEAELSEARTETLSHAAKAEKALTALADYRGVQALEEAVTEVAALQTVEDVSEAQGYYEAQHADSWRTQPEPEITEEQAYNAPDAGIPSRPKREPYVDRSKPYPITVDVFLGADQDYTTVTLTYYEGDDSLANEQEEIMDDKTRIMAVGTNLSNFGKNGEEPNEIYIRNDYLKMDIEVVRNMGRYAELVAGLGGNE